MCFQKSNKLLMSDSTFELMEPLQFFFFFTFDTVLGSSQPSICKYNIMLLKFLNVLQRGHEKHPQYIGR